ncbi:UDP-N-acetylmuramate dehydrogenase [Pelobacter sp. M08fum]|uniref:UDP-N-acetylenolpyruvoylglucosamine reductase n=2 Tax=Pelovirga terrestris TaxID=2771352 RepID=A0A8J6R638_9BACT|nr:UDP-N-acetylmuramate dehydrogenase [Pelovirga terrestris]
MLRNFQELLADKVARVAINEPLGHHNSWQIGGPADLLVEPENQTQVVEVMRFIQDQQLPLVVIGQGTNLLFDDAGVRGVVIKIGARMGSIDIADTRIVAGGGAWVPQLARLAMRAGLSGLEHCIGIPGTLGGLVMMNGGSHRHGIGEHVVRVTIVDLDATIHQLSAAECRFDYRYSALQERGAVVVEVELECPAGHRAEIRREMLRDLRERRRKFPRKQPNCGSVFLSTSAMHASVGPPGKIIEEAGLKGLRCGRAEVSQQHANFIVNRGGATSADVLQVISRIRSAVRQQLDFDLRCEVRYVSPTGKICPVDQVADRMFPAG